MRQLIAVVGPTGSGKTQLAVELAKKFNGVIISADSRQVYKGLDIGTNKEGVPGKWGEYVARTVDGIPQLLVDNVEPGSRFTLADWLNIARKILDEIWANGKIPIVVGGTGLYVTALTEGYQPGNGRFAQSNFQVDFESLVLLLDVERSILNKKSDERFSENFDALVTETKKLLDEGVSGEWLDSIGLDYRYAHRYVSNQLNREEAIMQSQAASRAYIRRQITWWRHHGEPVAVDSARQAESLVKRFRVS